MEKAISHVRHNRGRQIALQVRADNCSAVHLYRDMGFRVVDAVLEMHLPRERVKSPESQEEGRLPSLPARSRAKSDNSVSLRPRTYGEWRQEYALAQAAVPAASQHLYPLHQRRFQTDWDERVFRWLRNRIGGVREHRFGVGSQGVLSATVTVWAGRWRPDHRLEIMVHPHHRGQWEEALLDHALAILERSAPHPVYIEVFAVHDALVSALETRGFVVDRQLDQMELNIAGAP
jgi:GNAT superfamily N-acetyltransferase